MSKKEIGREELIERSKLFYKYWNEGKMDEAYSLLDENIVDHNAGDDEAGLKGVKLALNTVRSAFPDHQYKVLDIIPDEETGKFAVFLEASGTQEGDLFGIPPKNKKATWREVRIVRFADGKFVEHWAVVDSMSMMTQLGHAKPPKRESW